MAEFEESEGFLCKSRRRIAQKGGLGGILSHFKAQYLNRHFLKVGVCS